jgi:hypothetical protein
LPHWRDKQHWLASFVASMLYEAFIRLEDCSQWPAAERDLNRMAVGWMIDELFDFDDLRAEACRSGRGWA